MKSITKKDKQNKFMINDIAKERRKKECLRRMKGRIAKKTLLGE